MLPFIHVAVEVKEVSSRSCCETLMNSDTALDGNLDTFYKRIQGPYGHFKDSILVMLSYLQTSLK